MAPRPILAAALPCAIVVVGGGSSPDLFAAPALEAVRGCRGRLRPRLAPAIIPRESDERPLRSLFPLRAHVMQVCITRETDESERQ